MGGDESLACSEKNPGEMPERAGEPEVTRLWKRGTETTEEGIQRSCKKREKAALFP